MKVCELMGPKVVTVGPERPLREILQLMLRYHLNDVLVVDSEQRLAGIVTYPDLCCKLLPTERDLMEHEEYITAPQLMEDRVRDIAGIPVDEIMTRNVITVSPDLEALKAGAIMLAHRVKQLPVVRDDKVIGIVSHTDIGWGLMMQYAECMVRPERRVVLAGGGPVRVSAGAPGSRLQPSGVSKALEREGSKPAGRNNQ